MLDIGAKLSFLVKKNNYFELFLGLVFAVLIVLCMNKSMPKDLTHVFLSIPGMVVLVLLVFMLFCRPNKIPGILGIILIYLLFQKLDKPVVTEITSKQMKQSYEVKNMTFLDNKSESLEEDLVKKMLPLARENNMSQPKYESVNTSQELYKSV